MCLDVVSLDHPSLHKPIQNAGDMPVKTQPEMPVICHLFSKRPEICNPLQIPLQNPRSTLYMQTSQAPPPPARTAPPASTTISISTKASSSSTLTPPARPYPQHQSSQPDQYQNVSRHHDPHIVPAHTAVYQADQAHQLPAVSHCHTRVSSPQG